MTMPAIPPPDMDEVESFLEEDAFVSSVGKTVVVDVGDAAVEENVVGVGVGVVDTDVELLLSSFLNISIP